MNSEGIGDKLKAEFFGAELLYERKFKVSLRRVVTARIEYFWLIGDAAHIQSPVAGQGLSLAVLGGITLANALIDDGLSVVENLSNREKRVLLFTDFDYKMLITKQLVARFFRNIYWSIAGRCPVIAHCFFIMISGT